MAWQSLNFFIAFCTIFLYDWRPEKDARWTCRAVLCWTRLEMSQRRFIRSLGWRGCVRKWDEQLFCWKKVLNDAMTRGLEEFSTGVRVDPIFESLDRVKETHQHDQLAPEPRNDALTINLRLKESSTWVGHEVNPGLAKTVKIQYKSEILSSRRDVINELPQLPFSFNYFFLHDFSFYLLLGDLSNIVNLRLNWFLMYTLCFKREEALDGVVNLNDLWETFP